MSIEELLNCLAQYADEMLIAKIRFYGDWVIVKFSNSLTYKITAEKI